MTQSIGWGTSQNRVRFESVNKLGSNTTKQIVVEIETGDMDEACRKLAMYRAMKAADRAIDDVLCMPKEQRDRAWQELSAATNGMYDVITHDLRQGAGEKAAYPMET